MTGVKRGVLDRARVLVCAVALADERGLAAVTMRAVAAASGVEAMSLYHHVAGKEDLLVGMVEVVTAEVVLPRPGQRWTAELTVSARSLHDALLRHPWACALLDGRAAAGPVRRQYLEAVVATMREGGLPVDAAYRGLRLLDAYVYGSALLESSSAVPSADRQSAAASAAAELDAGHPYLRELAEYVASSDTDAAGDFDRGLESILDSIAREASAAGSVEHAGQPLPRD